MVSLEDQFHHAMLGVYENAKQHAYFATYFKQVIDLYGGLEAAKRLLAKPVFRKG
ncbi:MAG: hypothetical protein WCE68_00495 [Anaerolineales bacterium]